MTKMTELERLELILRRIIVDDRWTPAELMDAIIHEVARTNNERVVDARRHKAKKEARSAAPGP